MGKQRPSTGRKKVVIDAVKPVNKEEPEQAKLISSYKVFSSYIDRNSDGTVDVSRLFSKECYEKWVNTRKKAPLKPHESFRRSLTAHARGSDGRKPFDEDVEVKIMEVLRRKQRWKCFEGHTVSIGVQGFKALGYHENLRKNGNKNVKKVKKDSNNTTVFGRTLSKSSNTSLSKSSNTSSVKTESQINQMKNQMETDEGPPYKKMMPEKNPSDNNKPQPVFKQLLEGMPANGNLFNNASWNIQNLNSNKETVKPDNQAMASVSHIQNQMSPVAVHQMNLQERVVPAQSMNAQLMGNPSMGTMVNYAGGAVQGYAKAGRKRPRPVFGNQAQREPAEKEEEDFNVMMNLARMVSVDQNRPGNGIEYNFLKNQYQSFMNKDHLQGIVQTGQRQGCELFNPSVLYMLQISRDPNDPRFQIEYLCPEDCSFDMTRPIGTNLVSLKSFTHVDTDAISREIMQGDMRGVHGWTVRASRVEAYLTVRYGYPRLLRDGQVWMHRRVYQFGGGVIVLRVHMQLLPDKDHVILRFQDVSHMMQHILSRPNELF